MLGESYSGFLLSPFSIPVSIMFALFAVDCTHILMVVNPVTSLRKSFWGNMLIRILWAACWSSNKNGKRSIVAKSITDPASAKVEAVWSHDINTFGTMSEIKQQGLSAKELPSYLIAFHFHQLHERHQLAIIWRPTGCWRPKRTDRHRSLEDWLCPGTLVICFLWRWGFVTCIPLCAKTGSASDWAQHFIAL